jgi:hypothetical protein
MSRQLLFTLASKDLMPCSTAILVNSSEWPLVLIFIQAFSKIYSRLKESSLLTTASDRVAIFTSLLRAESASTIRFSYLRFRGFSELSHDMKIEYLMGISGCTDGDPRSLCPHTASNVDLKPKSKNVEDARPGA